MDNGVKQIKSHLTNITKANREIAEAILEPITEVDHYGPQSKYRGQLMRTRILNLKAEGKVTKAREVATRFLNTSLCDHWAPLIAVDICKLTSHAASREDLEKWLEFFESKRCKESAGLANLKLDLVSAYAREGKFDKAAELGEKLKAFTKAEDDPVSWHAPHQESVRSISTVSKGEFERRTIKARALELNTQRRARMKLVMGGAAGILVLSPIVYFTLQHVRGRKKGLVSKGR